MPHIVKPPLTWITWPVIYDDSSEVVSSKNSFQYDIEADNLGEGRLSPNINAKDLWEMNKN